MDITKINAEIKRLLAEGVTDIVVKNPAARHNLGVAILQPVHLTFAGSVGYYCAGLIDGPTIDIQGSAGWGVAESMLTGVVNVRGSAGNGAGAAIRGGTVVIHGDAAARAGVSLKGGLILIRGNCGYMSGFMGQKGKIVVCGDAGQAFADSMYETVCYVGGQVNDLGNDAVIEELTDEDVTFLKDSLSRHFPDVTGSAGNFKKVVAGRKLWNFEKHERAVWREAL
ncbi:MAG: glutamate synthase [Chloroflexi bacterium]|nr:glutamate synthase [Chloroflexota bacterium]